MPTTTSPPAGRPPAAGNFGPDFPEPKALDEARVRQLDLSADMMQIQSQMCSRKPVGRVSKREWEEYQTWKKGAARAQLRKSIQSKRLKRWIQEHEEPVSAGNRKAIAVLADLYTALKAQKDKLMPSDILNLLAEAEPMIKGYLEARGP